MGNKIRYYFSTGLFIGYLIKEISVNKNNPNDKLFNRDNTDLDKPFDIGVILGAGINFPIKSRFLLCFEIRNNLGIINISAVPVYNNGTIKTNSTNLLVGNGYKF